MIYNKIDLRHFIDEGFRFGMVMNGALSVNDDEVAICKIDSDSIVITRRHKVNGFFKYVKYEIPVEWKSRTYGCKDAYFVCSWCEKKTPVLYQGKYSALCRDCCSFTRQTICNHYKFIPSREQ